MSTDLSPPHRIRFSLRNMLLLVVVIAVALVLTDYLSPLDADRYLGFTEEQLLHDLGRPDQESSGYFGLPEPQLAKNCHTPQTMTYYRPFGIFKVTTCKNDGKRIVVRARWLNTFMMF